MHSTFPSTLKIGSTVGLIQPSGAISDKACKTAIKNIETIGFNVYLPPSIPRKHGYLGGTDQERANEIHQMFTAPEIDAIWCIRGGYGIQRILPLIQLDLIKSNPKPFIGFSDVTAFLNYITQETGLVTYHGIMGVSAFSYFDITNFHSVVIEQNFPHQLTPLIPKLQHLNTPTFESYTISKGIAIGHLVGGNLALLVSAIGTPYDINLNGKLLFLEEIGEAPYRIDRMLTQLLLANKLDSIIGIAIGTFNKCRPEDHDWKASDSFTIREILMEKLSHLNIPILYGLPFGHTNYNATLPVGGLAKLDATKQELILLANPQEYTH